MNAQNTPESIARQRLVRAASILENKADLRGYPHRYLAILSDQGLLGERMTCALAAAEALVPWGWDLINVTTAERIVWALLRRRDS